MQCRKLTNDRLEWILINNTNKSKINKQYLILIGYKSLPNRATARRLYYTRNKLIYHAIT